MDEDDARFICPRPRAVRACNSCKAHKTRCLPSARSDQCRRCEKIGTICVYSDVQQSKNKSQTKRPEKEESALEALLDQVTPASLEVDYEDQSEKVVQIHGNLFGCPQAATKLTTQPQPLQQNEVHQEEKSGKCTSKKPHITASQLDQLLQSFRLKTVYFPFITLPEDTSAGRLGQTSPFLLLSILVISSVDEPLLQKSLDERFRNVIATRVVMQGEKSIDYLQGLLVYLAWHPTNLKPINHQMFQYMQLAIGMISDLDLVRKIESRTESPTNQAIARNIVLGCYFLSASIAMAFRRPNNLSICPGDELLRPMLLSKNDAVEPAIAATFLLFRFIEKVHNINLQTKIAKLSSWTECPLQKLTQSLVTELERLENEVASQGHASPKLQIMRRFARVKIYSICLEQEKTLPKNQINPYTFLDIIPACATEINRLLEYIGNMPTTDFKNFSFTDWAPMILSVITFPKLNQFSPLDLNVATMWQSTIQTEYTTYLANTDRMCARLDEASITKRESDKNTSSSSPGHVPDLFYLFSTIFRLFKNKLVQDYRPLSPIDHASERSNKARSKCPVLNGDIQNTDYWTMWMNSNNLMSDAELFGVDGEGFSGFEVQDAAGFDLDAWVHFLS